MPGNIINFRHSVASRELVRDHEDVEEDGFQQQPTMVLQLDRDAAVQMLKAACEPIVIVLCFIAIPFALGMNTAAMLLWTSAVLSFVLLRCDKELRTLYTFAGVTSAGCGVLISYV